MALRDRAHVCYHVRRPFHFLPTCYMRGFAPFPVLRCFPRCMRCDCPLWSTLLTPACYLFSRPSRVQLRHVHDNTQSPWGGQRSHRSRQRRLRSGPQGVQVRLPRHRAVQAQDTPHYFPAKGALRYRYTPRVAIRDAEARRGAAAGRDGEHVLSANRVSGILL